MASWLDNTGLAYLWGKIKARFVAAEERLDKLDPPYKNLFCVAQSAPGYPDASGVMVPQTTSMERTSVYIPVTEGQTYTIQIWNTGAAATYPTWYCVQFYTASAFLSQAYRGEPGTQNVTATYTAPAGATRMRVAVRYVDRVGYNNYVKVMVEEGSVAHDFVRHINDRGIYEYYANLGGGVSLFVRDRVCVLELAATVNLASSWTEVTLSATIPERFRPSQGTHRAAVISNNTGGRCANLNVGTDGSIHVSGQGGTAIGNQYCYGTLVWIC